MDVLLVPTAPRPFTRAEVDADPVGANSKLGTYTNFVNLLDLSALAIPAGFRSDGVPWGVTLIAPAWQENEMLAFGSQLHAATGVSLGATGIPLRETRMTVPTPAVDTIRLAVVGAHLSGLPLNSQLTSRGARLVWKGTTAPHYRLYALPGTVPRKPGLVRVTDGGMAIEVEVWEMPTIGFGGFTAGVPPPLCIGTITLKTGESVKGFLCEAYAVGAALDITVFGGWKAYCAAR
jgi:allophanate hydrolase